MIIVLTARQKVKTMSFRVDHYGGPIGGKTITVDEQNLPEVKRVYIRAPATRDCANGRATNKDCAYDFGRYHLYPMQRDGVKFFMYVYEDSRDEFHAVYHLGGN